LSELRDVYYVDQEGKGIRCNMLSFFKISFFQHSIRKIRLFRHRLYKIKRRKIRLIRALSSFIRLAGGLHKAPLSAHKILKEKGVSGLRHALGVSEY